MLPELSAAMTAVKETVGLVKVISGAKTDAEIKTATFELQNKLLTLQTECFALGDAISLKNEEVVRLKAIIAEFENFSAQVEGYVLEQLDSGTFVYSKKELVSGREISIKLCAHCYSKHIMAILQLLPVRQSSLFHKSRCLQCHNEFLMDRNSGYLPPPTMAELGRLLND